MLYSCALGRLATSSCCRSASVSYKRAAAASVRGLVPRRCSATARTAALSGAATMTPQDCEKLREALCESLNITRQPLEMPLVSKVCEEHFNVGEKLEQLGATGHLQHELLEEARVVVDREAPLLVVEGDKKRVVNGKRIDNG